MADISHAVAEYGPQLVLKSPVGLSEFAEWIALRSGVSKYEIELVLEKIGEGIFHFCQEGQPVQLDGVGTFTPDINRIGEYGIGFSAGVSLRNSINAAGAYRGAVLNRESIGWTNEQYREAWNRDHADDPLEV